MQRVEAVAGESAQKPNIVAAIVKWVTLGSCRTRKYVIVRTYVWKKKKTNKSIEKNRWEIREIRNENGPDEFLLWSTRDYFENN